MTSVITTINYPTEAVKKLANLTDLIVVGDRKTPKDWDCDDMFFLGIDDHNSNFSVMQFMPENHYARKNLGYLAAIKFGAKVIYDTDDDNIPCYLWEERGVEVRATESVGKGWYNVYNLFSDEFVWPRGFSLNHIHDIPKIGVTKFYTSSIQQGLSNGEPDVDALFRFIRRYEIRFEKQLSVYLNPGAWCSFNSQSTWWFPKAYPLMYLPVTASFRMTDIWRSFIAQRCLWEIGEGVTFHSPSEVFQDRNKHDLLKDFEDEIPGYLKNDLIVQTLSNVELKQGVENICDNLYTCYKALEEVKVFPMHEIRSVNAWIKDIQKIWKH